MPLGIAEWLQCWLTHLLQFQRRTHGGAATRGRVLHPSSLPGTSSAFSQNRRSEIYSPGKQSKVSHGNVSKEWIHCEWWSCENYLFSSEISCQLLGCEPVFYLILLQWPLNIFGHLNRDLNISERHCIKYKETLFKLNISQI